MISLIVTIIIVGLLLWAVQVFIPMDAKIRLLLQVVVVVCLFLYVLQFFGIWQSGIRFNR